MDKIGATDDRRVARTALAVALLALLTLATPLGALAHGGDSYGYRKPSYAFATGEDGTGYYKTYDGYHWSGWYGWDDQPASFRYQPSAVTYHGKVYVFYAGAEGGIYYNAYDGYGWAGWYHLAEGYRFGYAPYAKVNDGYLYLFVTVDGYRYSSYYDGYAWSDWAPYSGDGYESHYGY